ncbi:hypothetical protein SGQ44_10525 [Flavobacterium sp. Fl-77]|uniref:Uncharacterized protein n=1 Tax=Flavobacterium flavipigmentatum TaxID=2893884 RepID=A0AAJ2VYA2_9FLAO|nr:MULTISPECIES: hypothetical protein [unclassified Flavobacterium]MDX6182625.1 hypothetical protein [Flavobacterium sp. Fl-33]MDX6186195.1 hypothetical protein [Flavobacterium sp. Fl-77]UFH38342.1 hypothetical protein LNP22_16615 [Flavobacterium sp. F-70]
MKIKIHKIQKILFLIVFSLFGFSSIFAQVNNTKIKDGTVSTGAEKAKAGAIFELESNNKGMLTSRLTTAQRDAIPPANLTDGLLLYNLTTGCFDYWSQIQNIWLSICGTLPPAIFDISPTQCTQVAASGIFKQGVSLNLSNYLSIPVTVTQPGVYSVSATTTNGYYFNTNGTFPSAGSYILNLPGTGTPNNGYNIGDPGDPVNISLNGVDSSCVPNIFVEKASVDFVINCGSISPLGDYFIGIPLTSSNKITLTVNPTTIGFWSMTTNTVNGYSFSGTGTFNNTTPNQSVELLGTGTPVASGTNSFNLSSNASTTATGSCTGIPVTVSTVAYTIDCATATQNGVYMQDVALSASNTITLPINVTATGQTTITTTTANGISFTSGLVNLSTLGPQNVMLTGTGMPSSAGTTVLTVSGTPGAAATCSLNVTIAPQPVTYTINCAGITTSGSYAPGIAMTATNTMTVPVNVTYVGAYTITTNSVNGVSFAATGTFTATGAQNVVMTATGTPVSGGTFSYAVSANSTNGATACNKSITFIFRTMRVLGLGGGVYQPGSSGAANSSRAILASTANFSATGTFPVQGITIFDGAYSYGTALRNLINTNNIDIVVIGYNYTPDAATITVLNNFVKNKKGVLIHSQENDAANVVNLVNTICGSTTVAIASTGTTYTNPILNISDSILEGPFGDVKGFNLGSDVNNSYYATGLPANVTSLSTQNGNATRIFSFKHTTLGYIYVGDSGWTAGDATNAATTIYPAKMSSTGLPLTKAYDSGIPVYNSIMYANTMAWAIKYVQANINSAYVIP